MRTQSRMCTPARRRPLLKRKIHPERTLHHVASLTRERAGKPPKNPTTFRRGSVNKHLTAEQVEAYRAFREEQREQLRNRRSSRSLANGGYGAEARVADPVTFPAKM